MQRIRRFFSRGAVVALVVVTLPLATRHAASAQGPLAAAAPATTLRITYPLDGTLFPPEIVAPTVVWRDETANVDHWYVVVRDDAGGEVLREEVDFQRWRPAEDRWREIKQRSAERDEKRCDTGTPP